MHVISDPSTPFWGHVPEANLHPGMGIRVTGHVGHDSERFSVNLVVGGETGHHAEHHSSFALHFDVRMHEDLIVVNTRHHKDWGEEDRHHHCPQRGHNFTISIHVEHEYYSIYLNGVHVCNFYHRIPVHEVGAMWIHGDVDIHQIEYHHEFQPHHHHHHHVEHY